MTATSKNATILPDRIIRIGSCITDGDFNGGVWVAGCPGADAQHQWQSGVCEAHLM